MSVMLVIPTMANHTHGCDQPGTVWRIPRYSSAHHVILVTCQLSMYTTHTIEYVWMQYCTLNGLGVQIGGVLAIDVLHCSCNECI